jgi:hypothetical protein
MDLQSGHRILLQAIVRTVRQICRRDGAFPRTSVRESTTSGGYGLLSKDAHGQDRQNGQKKRGQLHGCWSSSTSDVDQWREIRGKELFIVPPLPVYTVQGGPALFAGPKGKKTDEKVMLVWISEPCFQWYIS